ncbi:MAG TPA: CDP-glycerol glycerophosphotransferase family protein [Bacilli bacterium]|nr:CDP-glycerol glycerophosphotransferase family protein [Bacilli bacterium]
MIKKIVNAVKEGTFFEKVFHKIDVEIKTITRKIYEPFIKVKANRIIFLTFQGEYNCNPKAIADKLILDNEDYDLIWVIRNKRKGFDSTSYPQKLKLVVRGSFKFYFYAASSKIIVDNANNFEYLRLKKKKDQILIQTWHGSLGFKRLDAQSLKSDVWSTWKKKIEMAGQITDYCISNSVFETNVYRDSYWPNVEILLYGHPRNDILFNIDGKAELISRKVKKLYEIPQNTKIVLYAPTFRDSFDADLYNMDYKRLINALKIRFGGEWVVMVRFHFKLRNITHLKKYGKDIINVTNYGDIQELLCACDVGITDYSSWICDFVLTRKPGFLFAMDLDQYKNDRGFYYPLDTTPFPISQSADDLEKQILNFDGNKYKKAVNKFLENKGCVDDGNASDRVARKIKKIICD